MTLDLFEHYLPYATAQGVEVAWTRRYIANGSSW
jgi:hypothetical protein